MEILMTALEAEGFFKIGGIGDYVSGIAKVLANEKDFNVKVIIPKYEEIDANLEFLTSLSFDDSNSWGDDAVNFNLYKTRWYNVDFYFIENDYYFADGRNVYMGDDSYMRFAFFSRAIAETVKHMGWNIDIIHFNDFIGGLLPVTCKNTLSKVPKFVFTIHSIYYAGNFKIDENYRDLFNYYSYGNWKDSVCLMKEGIIHSDKLITVGISTAVEIQTPEGGYNCDKYIREKGGVTGLLNGVNYDLYPKYGDFADLLENKRKAKRNLQKKFNLEVDENIPLFMNCGRLSGKQKGGHLLLGVMDYLMENNCQFILLGDGEGYRQEFIECSKRYVNFIARIEHNEELARELYESSDILLMPSLCEPNGLSQIIAMYHGTVPIVHDVGGLKDTIVDFLKYPDNGNGFKFYSPDADEFKKAISKALEIFKDKEKWGHIMENCYNEDYSWEKMIKPYVKIYTELCEG